MATKKTISKPDNSQKELKAQRIYNETKELDHDLFVLEESEVVKDHGYNPERPVIIKHKHKHIFHSIDSNGKKQEYCTPSLGHTHKVIEQGIDENGHPYVKFGPPIVRVKRKGKRVDYAYRYEGEGKNFESHNHEVTYKYSEKLVPRKPNPDAMKMLNEMTKEEKNNLTNPVGPSA